MIEYFVKKINVVYFELTSRRSNPPLAGWDVTPISHNPPEETPSGEHLFQDGEDLVDFLLGHDKRREKPDHRGPCKECNDPVFFFSLCWSPIPVCDKGRKR